MRMMFDAGSASDGALQRSHGVARIRFEARDGQTRLMERYAAAPARLLTPRMNGAAPEVVLANTTGGVAGGDSLFVSVTMGAGADATVSGQAAERIYRALDAPARITTDLDVASGAVLEWLPQETILFNGALLNRRITVNLAADARLLMTETIVLGRKAHGETFTNGRLLDRWSINRAGHPIWRDALMAEGGADSLGAATGFHGARALATVIYAGPNAEALLEPLRALLPDDEGMTAGATYVRGLLVARILGAEAGALKHRLSEIIGALRAAALGRPATAPRVWLC